jgi:hypothetical protein
MNKLYSDILYIIFNNLDFLSKIRLRCVSKNLHKLEIHDFFNIPFQYINLLNDEILFNYNFIKYLDASYNSKITNISHMKNLIKLDASGYFSKINDNSIKNINLQYLNASHNPFITNVNHMDKLIELDAYGEFCGISDDGIKNLNLIKLDAQYNTKITFYK